MSTLGKTATGQCISRLTRAFQVPATHDLIKTLFSPKSPKTIFEYSVLMMMMAQLILFLVVRIKREWFLCLFLFWRLCYNVGLGILLKLQSEKRLIVKWAQKHGFEPRVENRKNWTQFIVNQISIKLGPDFNYETTPIEFNAWIIFRGLVDMILLNDFFSYVLFSCSFFKTPEQIGTVDVMRYIAGSVMIAFNVWVKVDAHRVVKDYAWYWGDFFFLIEASLTFDGVFEMAPHPMYSVGYIGFYGTALIANSYTVLFVSLLAHTAQFAFLYYVENPHIDKTYNLVDASHRDESREILKGYFRRDLIVFKNFDWFRTSDLFSMVIAAYSIILALVIGPITSDFTLFLYVGHALLWRFIHTWVLGAVLYYQSETKFWTRHFIKKGDTIRDAFQNWKILYNLTMSMTFCSFIICAVRVYNVPTEWTFEGILFRHVAGILLILLHLWAAWSIYDVLNEFGWFYGDFFITEVKGKKKLLYTGIYRFLNNPEKIMGHASFWGITLICNSVELFSITLFGQISSWIFLSWVEAPHMNKIYGSQVRPQAGAQRAIQKGVKEIEKVFDAILPSPKKKGLVSTGALKKSAMNWEIDNSDKDSSVDYDSSASEIAVSTSVYKRSIKHRVQSTKAEAWSDDELERSRSQSDRLSIVERSRQVVEDLVFEVEKAVNQTFPILADRVGTRQYDEQVEKIPKELFHIECEEQFELGQSIIVKFKVPKSFVNPNDWIGIYLLLSNPSKQKTIVSSEGKWLYVTGSHLKSDSCENLLVAGSLKREDDIDFIEGKLEFFGEYIPWKVGTFEARYHFNNGYSVICSTSKFSIKVPPVEADSIEKYMQQFVERAIQFSSLKSISIATSDDLFELILKNCGTIDKATFDRRKRLLSKRLVYLIEQTFKIDFDWQVVVQNPTIEQLKSKISEAKTALL